MATKTPSVTPDAVDESVPVDVEAMLDQVDEWVAKAPRPDLRRPKNQRFIASLSRADLAGKQGEALDTQIAYDLAADMDEAMEQALGKVWVMFITAVPAEIQPIVLTRLAYQLSSELGKG